MALKKTGVGKVDLYPMTNSKTHAVLYNFDIDGAELKPAHKNFLDAQVIPLLSQGGSTGLIGLCSRTGSTDHNQTLSEKRVEAVYHFLQRAARIGHIFIYKGVGESAAEEAGQDDDVEDEYYRAVEVIVSPEPIPPPPPRKKKKPKPYPPKHEDWRKVELWLEGSIGDGYTVKRLTGRLAMRSPGSCYVYGWDFSAILGGLSVPIKGKPPISLGKFNTRALLFSYNAEVFNPIVFWKKKMAYVHIYGDTISITIKNALPRALGPDYLPFRGDKISTQGKDLSFKLKPDTPEPGSYEGFGSIRNPKSLTIKDCVFT